MFAKVSSLYCLLGECCCSNAFACYGVSLACKTAELWQKLHAVWLMGERVLAKRCSKRIKVWCSFQVEVQTPTHTWSSVLPWWGSVGPFGLSAVSSSLTMNEQHPSARTTQNATFALTSGYIKIPIPTHQRDLRWFQLIQTTFEINKAIIAYLHLYFPHAFVPNPCFYLCLCVHLCASVFGLYGELVWLLFFFFARCPLLI